MPNVVSASIETITKRSLFIEAEMKAGEQPQCPSHSHAPGPRAGTGFFWRRAGRPRPGCRDGARPPALAQAQGILERRFLPRERRCAGSPPTPTAGRGWKGLVGTVVCRGQEPERSPQGGGSPSPRSTPRPGTQSELGILHLKCPDLWPRQSPGRAGQGALRAEPSQKAGVLLLLHPLLPAPRDTVPTRPQDPLGPADPEAGGDPFSLPTSSPDSPPSHFGKRTGAEPVPSWAAIHTPKPRRACPLTQGLLSWVSPASALAAQHGPRVAPEHRSSDNKQEARPSSVCHSSERQSGTGCPVWLVQPDLTLEAVSAAGLPL